MVTGVIGTEDRNRFHTGANTIGYAYSPITIPGQGKPGQAVAEMLYSLQPFQMSDGVLRHGGIPFGHASEEWLGVEPKNLLQFFTDDTHYFFV